MYAEQLVQKWFEEHRTGISENELKRYGLYGKMAWLILEDKYEGKYCPPEEGHSCGFYTFKNPLGHYEKRHALYFIIPDVPLKTLDKIGFFQSYDNAIKEILRLEYDEIYWYKKDEIPEYMEMIKTNMIDNMYHKTRYWFIWEEEVWVV